jgi:hypothetical protein
MKALIKRMDVNNNQMGNSHRKSGFYSAGLLHVLRG